MQVRSSRTLPHKETPCPQGAGSPGSCAVLAASNGLNESWPGHNCHKNGHCMRKKSLPLEKGRK